MARFYFRILGLLIVPCRPSIQLTLSRIFHVARGHSSQAYGHLHPHVQATPHGKRLPRPLLQLQEHPPAGPVSHSRKDGRGKETCAQCTSGISKAAINNSYCFCHQIWNELHKVYFKNCRNQSMYNKEQINNIYCGSGITTMPSH